MARRKKMETTAELIERTEALVLKKKQEYDDLISELKRLRDLEMKEKQQALLAAADKSKWSYEQIMGFIQSDPADHEEY